MSKQPAAKMKIAPSAGPLKAYFDRVNNIEDDRQAVADAAKDLTAEINSAGLNAKAIKRMVKKSRVKTDEQLEADIELYTALLGEPGATYRSVAEQTKVPRSTLHRLVPKSDRGTEPAHDTETGEITEGGAPNPARDGGAPSKTSEAGTVVATNSEVGIQTATKAEPVPPPEDDLEIPSFLKRSKDGSPAVAAPRPTN